jgi:hypothetical protein
MIRHYKKSPYLHDSLKGFVSEHRLWVETSTGHADVPWEAFIKRKQDDKIIMLYRGSNLFHMLAEELFANAGDWEEAKRLIEQKVPPKRA